MVTFSELRAATPAAWSTAANDLLSAAKQCERIMDDIHDNGVRPLSNSWEGKGFEVATQTLEQVAGRAEVASILARAAVDPLDTLNDAVSIAQQELFAVLDTVTTQGLSLNETTGWVSVPPGATGAAAIHLMFAAMDGNKRISEAVAAATAADQACCDALTKVLAADPATTTAPQAQAIQQDAIADALSEMRDTIPLHETEEGVATWWSQLSPTEQLDLERACPVELYRLTGFPQTVKDQIARTDRGYNSAEAVDWALKNYNDDSIDEYGNNCANFVSHALHNAGLGYKLDGGTGLLTSLKSDPNGWGQTSLGEANPSVVSGVMGAAVAGLPGALFGIHQGPKVTGYVVGGVDRTRTWFNADSQEDFFLQNGGSTVQTEDIRPGDVAYLEYTQSGPIPSGGDMTAGQAHHAALVTAVLPDGQVIYTQHSLGATNYSVTGRVHEIEQDEGQQNVRIVSPKKTW